MSILSSISKPQDRPVIVTICGDSGMGKTTLASTFPKPIVIRAEDGLQAIPSESRPDAFPLIHKEEEAVAAVGSACYRAARLPDRHYRQRNSA